MRAEKARFSVQARIFSVRGHVLKMTAGRGVAPETNRIFFLPCGDRIPLPHAERSPYVATADKEVFFMKIPVFCPGWWRASAAELKNLRRVVFAALVCALGTLVGGMYLPVADNLRIYFTFFITAMGCAVYGPIMGLAVAAVTDTLNFLLFPSGPYFPGYMLSEMLGALIYSVFLYRQKITLPRLFCAKTLVNFLCNVLLGSLWSRMLYGKAYLLYLYKSLIKNTLLLPLEVVLLAAFFAVIILPFSRLGLLPGHTKEDLALLSPGHSALPTAALCCLFGAVGALTYGTVLKGGLPFIIAGGILVVGALVLGLMHRIKRRR